jgi:uncharacterized protein (TIGR02145 family)
MCHISKQQYNRNKETITSSVMKKNLIFAIILSFMLISCEKEKPLESGKVSFKTNKTWVVDNQEWSDVVMSTSCRKKTFTTATGRDDDGRWLPVADCRSNPGYGDLFSGGAINEFKDLLCPAPWRVPTMQDFYDLDVALGGGGRGRGCRLDFIQIVSEKYLNPSVWGGTFGGFCGIGGGLDRQGEQAEYWTQTQDGSPRWNYNFKFTNDDYVCNNAINTRYGAMLRCVRDVKK